MQRLERHLGPPRVRLGRRDPESPEERHRALARLETSLTELGDRFREHRAGPLTWVQLAALRYLLAHGPVTIGTLSRALNVSFSSTTGIVDRLVQLRLVERVHPEDDRRTVIVVATEEGADVARAMVEDRVDLVDHILAGATVTELLGLHEFLQRVLAKSRRDIEAG